MNAFHQTRILWQYRVALVFSLLVSVNASALGAVKLPHIFANHMVLQRDMQIPVWGFAEPGENITVKLDVHEVQTTTDANGQWLVKLPPMSVGGPHEMTVKGVNTVQLTDVLIGEVWVCSGQSNMQWSVKQSQNSEEEIAAANYPEIRLFDVPRVPSGVPAPDTTATWRLTQPETVGNFSAVAYFFGRHLHQEVKVPIGLIASAWGGTRIEPWTPLVGFTQTLALQWIAEDVVQADREHRNALQSGGLYEIEAWVHQTRKALERNESYWPLPDMPHPLQSHQRPTGLYNGMIAPIVPFAVRGALWYQGESNLQDGMLYYEKMKALINGWRHVWNQGEFPFYFVQLAPFSYNTSPEALPKIWEAQTTALSLPNTGMVVTTDVGNLKDIHPRNKQAVGQRLALWALAKTYGFKELIYSGPLYDFMAVESNKIRLHFKHVGSGLVSRDGNPLTWFEVAGKDMQFVQAEAKVDGDTVLVWSESVTEPIAARFAWHQDAEPNLMNREGLPASPFRTHAE